VPTPADGRHRLGPAGPSPELGILERDELTGLPGRRRLQRCFAEPIVAGLARGVAVLDVDAFALVNETYGPDAGDDVLVELARRLAPMAARAVIGRWQADSFVWVIDAEEPAAALETLCARVSAALDEPFQVGADRLRLTVSAGLVTSVLAPSGDLLLAAMDALRAAKDTGRDRAVWYSAAMRTGSTGGFRLANDLHHGIESGELRLHFQPIMQLATNEVVGVEALVRWERPGVGLLNPVSFIDMAERTGQIVLLGSWVARHACLAAADLVQRADSLSTVSINVSARQLSDPGLVEMLRGALEISGCAPSTIIVEVTETAVMHDLDAATATLEAIKALGVGLDLDDFGTGYSSLLYLKHFPVDRIKIDRTFVKGLGTDLADTAIVASTIALAHSVGILAVAEGVETADQLRLLRQMGCDFAQGYLLSRPLGRGQLDEWLAQHVPTLFEPRAAAIGSAGHEPLIADARADWRDEVADERDGVADQRDEVADGRDRSGDERDGASDVRDGLADLRDEVADVRDDVAAARDTMADGRGAVGGCSEALGAQDGSALARRDAAIDRHRASADRVAGASERVRAEHERDVAQAERESGASERVQAEHVRDAAVADRSASTRRDQ
jgi:diguanylate cyclase (GGDEF)-like protein